jgi:hypothetical protein
MTKSETVFNDGVFRLVKVFSQSDDVLAGFEIRYSEGSINGPSRLLTPAFVRKQTISPLKIRPSQVSFPYIKPPAPHNRRTFACESKLIALVGHSSFGKPISAHSYPRTDEHRDSVAYSCIIDLSHYNIGKLRN